MPNPAKPILPPKVNPDTASKPKANDVPVEELEKQSKHASENGKKAPEKDLDTEGD